MSEDSKPKIYMKQNQSQQDQNVNKNIKQEAKSELIESSLEPLFEGIQILEISGGVAHITMPLSLLKILNLFFKKLDLQMDK
jgi:transcription antitermination factor NusG